MVVHYYCRIHGLVSEQGRRLNGRVGIIQEGGGDNQDVVVVGCATERVRVLIDGEAKAKSLKRCNLNILVGNNIQSYTLTWSFNPQNPSQSCWTISHDDDDSESEQQQQQQQDDGPPKLLMAGVTFVPDGYHTTNVEGILHALIGFHGEGLKFNTPTVINISDLNTATVLNKLLANNTPGGFLNHLKSQTAPYNKQHMGDFQRVVKELNSNPNMTLIKWNPNQTQGDQSRPSRFSISLGGKQQEYTMVKMAAKTGGQEEEEIRLLEKGTEASGIIEDLQEDYPGIKNSYKELVTTYVNNSSSVPAQCCYFPPLLVPPPPQDTSGSATAKVLTSILRGIYHIYPSPTIENCYNVMYAADGEKSIRMGSFMDQGCESITEWHLYTWSVLGDQERFNTPYLLHQDPAMFWNIMLHRKEYDAIKGGLGVSPILSAAPKHHRQLLMKRTTTTSSGTAANDDDDKIIMGLVPPPAAGDGMKTSPSSPSVVKFTSLEERKRVSDRNARIGALLCMIELARRCCPGQKSPTTISFEVADHLLGTDIERDINKALSFINNGRNYFEATRTLKDKGKGGVPSCECCGANATIQTSGGEGGALLDEEKANKTTKLKGCSGCKMVVYCSRECQKKDYKAKHKKICKLLQADKECPCGEKTYASELFEFSRNMHLRYGARGGGGASVNQSSSP